MIYELGEVERQLSLDAGEAIAAYEKFYFDQIESAADAIASHRGKSPVVLLAGPSASGKTTSGIRIVEELRARGIGAHLISMDNYFRNWDLEDFPKTETGAWDLESPFCLDIPLLNAHFAALEAGEPIMVPQYDFHTHSRMTGISETVIPGKEDVFIFEGIHALNPEFTSRHPDAFRLYICLTADYMQDGEVICRPVILRLIRRMVRDFLFRGSDATYTLSLWGNVIASEKNNIAAYRGTAHREINTALGYELQILRPVVLPMLETLPYEGMVVEAVRALSAVKPAARELVPVNSILREFVGDSDETGK